MSDLFAQAAELMLAGMGVVFVFLIVLTGAVALLTQLCPVDAAATPTTSAPPATASQSSAEDGSQAKKLAAIAVAVQRYRKAQSPDSSHKE